MPPTDNTPSPNMNLPVPTVGVSAGPQYATDIDNCMTLIDAHDHSPSNGVPITPSGMNINADLSFQSTHNLIAARTIRFTPQSGVLVLAADVGCLYEVGVDLYYNDGNGNNVRMTQGGAVAGSVGSISNLTSPASASYSAGSATFVWQSDANISANLDAGSLILRNITASSKGLTLSPPNAMASDYTITLPALPASTLPVSISTSGAMSAAQITLIQLVAAVQQALNPTGTILAYGGASAPSGYLLCDGTAVSRTTYAALFSAIGTAYGYGNNSTTFNLPDFRGRFIRGVDNGAGHDPDAASRTAMNTGGNTGDNVGSLQGDATKPNGLTLATKTFTNNSSLGAGSASNVIVDSNQGGSTSTTANIIGGGNETRPVNGYATYIIKT